MTRSIAHETACLRVITTVLDTSLTQAVQPGLLRLAEAVRDVSPEFRWRELNSVHTDEDG